jgi:hypothetical protein
MVGRLMASPGSHSSIDSVMVAFCAIEGCAKSWIVVLDYVTIAYFRLPHGWMSLVIFWYGTEVVRISILS